MATNEQKTHSLIIIKTPQAMTTELHVVCEPMSEFCLGECPYKNTDSNFCNAHKSNIEKVFDYFDSMTQKENNSIMISQ